MSQSPEPLKSEELHPLAQIMKGGGLPQGDSGSDPNVFTPERGVRGDDLSFPQDAGPTPYDPDLHGQIQEQIRSLGWSGDAIRQFIADQFGGKRWPELTEDERLLLLYRLRVLDSLDAGEPADVTIPASSSTTR
jgi:hypothetical protein